MACRAREAGTLKIPNLLTLSRMFLAPVFVFCFTRQTGWGDAASLALAITFEITDLLDGQVARRTGQVSDLGKFLDPLADSIARFTIFLCFLHRGYASIWVVAILFWRDAIVANLRILGVIRGVIIGARVSGKVKAWFQGTATISILVFAVWPDLFGLGIENVPTFARVITWIVAVATALSGIDYLYGNRKLLREMTE